MIELFKLETEQTRKHALSESKPVPIYYDRNKQTLKDNYNLDYNVINRMC